MKIRHMIADCASSISAYDVLTYSMSYHHTFHLWSCCSSSQRIQQHLHVSKVLTKCDVIAPDSGTV